MLHIHSNLNLSNIVRSRDRGFSADNSFWKIIGLNNSHLKNHWINIVKSRHRGFSTDNIPVSQKRTFSPIHNPYQDHDFTYQPRCVREDILSSISQFLWCFIMVCRGVRGPPNQIRSPQTPKVPPHVRVAEVPPLSRHCQVREKNVLQEEILFSL